MGYMKDVTGARVDALELPDRRRQVHAASLSAWGHSYPFGIGASDFSRSFGAIVAERLRLPFAQESVSGTAFSTPGSGASWVKILQKVSRPGLGAISGSIAGSGLRGYSTPGGLHLLMVGVNDLNIRGNTTPVMEGFRHCLRTGVSRLRAATIWEETDATFSYDVGFASAVSSTTENSGATYRFTNNSSHTYRFTTPADFPGGTVAIGLTARNGSGAIHTFTLDGAPAGQVDARNTQTVDYIGCVHRIPNVPAGSHVIQGSLSNLTTLTQVDYAQWEPPTRDCPLVVLLKQPYPVDYSLYGSVAPGPPTDAGVDALNGIIDAVAAEFDERVIVVDTAALNHDASMFAADKLHPSDKGHRALADLTMAALASYRFDPVHGSTLRRREEFATAAPTGTRTSYRVGDVAWNTAPVGGAFVGWVCTVEGRPGTWKGFGALEA